MKDDWASFEIAPRMPLAAEAAAPLDGTGSPLVLP
jgi:hypothetical protein